jgi:hypothetical protein
MGRAQVVTGETVTITKNIRKRISLERALLVLRNSSPVEHLEQAPLKEKEKHILALILDTSTKFRQELLGDISMDIPAIKLTYIRNKSWLMLRLSKRCVEKNALKYGGETFRLSKSAGPNHKTVTSHGIFATSQRGT